MSRGATAKQAVENKIREVFGADFVGVQDKKLYVWADDDGEKVQVCLTLTCPKTPIGVSEDGIDFENSGNFGEPSKFQPAEITNEELDRVREMIKKFDL